MVSKTCVCKECKLCNEFGNVAFDVATVETQVSSSCRIKLNSSLVGPGIILEAQDLEVRQ